MVRAKALPWCVVLTSLWLAVFFFRASQRLVNTAHQGRALARTNHLTCVFNHVGTEVMAAKLPISQCENLVDKKGVITDKGTLEAMEKYVDDFLNF